MIYLLRKNTVILFTKARYAGNPWLKMKGLLGKQSMDPEEALIFPKAPSLHTIGMKFSIDIAFLDSAKRVLTCFEKVKPYRILPYIRSSYTVEMPEDAVQRKSIQPGDQLLWEESGQTVVEFALLIASIVLSLAVVWPSLNNTFNTYIRNILDYLVDY